MMGPWKNSQPQGDLEKMKSPKLSMIFGLLLGTALKQVKKKVNPYAFIKSTAHSATRYLPF
jgi:hypothetical protein